MVPLATVGYINYLFSLPFFLSIAQGCQICGRIIAGSVRFSDNKRLLGKAFVLWVKDNQGPVVFLANLDAWPKFLVNSRSTLSR